MKKMSRILSLVLSFALVITGIIIATFTASAADAEYSTGFSYTVTEEDEEVNRYQQSDLGAVIADINGSTTITMHGDTVYDTGKLGAASIGTITSGKGKLTLDLGGNTLTVIQRSKAQTIQVNSQNKFTVKNGTIKVLWAVDGKATKTFPLFELNHGNAQLLLENVDTYSGPLIFGTGHSEDIKVTINGGTHYVMYDNSDVTGGFVESRTAMLFAAKNATFYVGGKTPLIASLSYSAVNGNYEKPERAFDPASTFRFDNCDVIASSIENNLIKCANEYTYIYFNNSRIFGSLGKKYNDKTIGFDLGYFDTTEPPKNGLAINKIGAGQIFFGAGTMYATSATVDDVTKTAVFADGNSYGDYKSTEKIIVPKTENTLKDRLNTRVYDLYLPADTLDLSVDNYYDTSTNKPLTVKYDKMFVVPSYSIEDSEGNVLHSYIYGEAELSEVIEEACTNHPGSTVKLLYEAEMYVEGNKTLARINSALTLDLNGHTFSLFQIPTTEQPNAQSAIRISTTDEVRIIDSSPDKTGVIGVKQMDANYAYPFFVVDGDESGKAVTVNVVFEDITFYGSSLIYIYGGLDSRVTVNGGEYNCIYSHTGSIGGFVQAVCDVDMVINDAVINLGTRGYVLGSAGRNVSLTDAESTYTFNNCIITSDDASRVILRSSNEFTEVRFNSCYIKGSMAPNITAGFDDNENNAFLGDVKGPRDHSIIFDGHTKFDYSATFTEGIVSPVAGRFVTAAEKDLENTIINYTIKEIEGDAVFHGFGSGVATEKSLTLDGIVSGEKFKVTYGDTAYYGAADFDDAVAEAKSKANGAGTITFLCDYTVTKGYNGVENPVTGNVYYIAKLDFPLTIDLDGRSLNLVQGYLDDNSQEAISIDSTVVIKNGTITAKNKGDAKNYPVFIAESGGFDFTLENIVSYTGGMFYSYNCDEGSKFTIKGGEHHIPYKAHGGWASSWFEAHTGFTFEAEDAKFHLAADCNNNLATAMSNSSPKAMSFLFDNCDIIAENTSTQIFRCANDITSITFNNCRIKGKLAPPASSALTNTNSSYNQNAITSITFGIGTVLEGTATEGLIVTPTGYLFESLATPQQTEVTFYVTDEPAVSGEGADAKVVIDPKRRDLSYSFSRGVLDAVIVELKDKDGVVLSSTTILPGTAIGELPEIAPKTEKTGYVKVTYTGNYVDASGNVVTKDTLVKTEDVEIYPEVNITPYFSDAMYNLKLMGHITIQVMLPLDELADNVTISELRVGSVWETAEAKSSNPQSFNGKKYSVYNLGQVGATDIANELTVMVRYSVVVCGRTHEVTQTIRYISALKYINTVLADDTMSAAAPLLANMVRYSYYVCLLAGYYDKAEGEINNKYKAIRDTYIDGNGEIKVPCTDFNDNYFKLPNNLVTTDSEEFKRYVEWIRFDIENYQPKFKLKCRYNTGDGALNVTAVKFEVVEGFKQASAGSEINWAKNLSVDINSKWGTSHYYQDGKDVFGVYNGNVVGDNDWVSAGKATGVDTGFIHIVCPDNLPAYNIIRNIRITLTLSDGTTVSAVYNLREYYNAIAADESLTEENRTIALEAIKAIHAYSDVAAAYRFGPAKDAAGPNGYVSYERANGYSSEE